MAAQRDPLLLKIRKRAEQLARQQPVASAGGSAEDYQSLIHELNVHKIELEIQNEELRKAQNDLEEAKNKYADLFHTAPVGYLVLSDSALILEANKTFTNMAAGPSDRLTGRPFSDFLEESSKRIFLSQFRSFFKNPVGKHMDLYLNSGGQAERAIRVVGGRGDKRVRRPENDAAVTERIRIAVVEITEQITAEKHLATYLKERELRYDLAELMLTSTDEQMFEAILKRLRVYFESEFGYFGYLNEDGDLVCPSMTREIYPRCKVPDKDIVFPRSKWGGLWGKSLVSRTSLIKNTGLRLPEGHLHLDNALAVPIVNQQNLIGQIALANKSDGYSEAEKKLLESIANWIGPVLSARLERDRQLQRRLQAEDALKQAQRMESIGVLAGGIAHDFNNMLSPIIGYTDLMLTEIPETAPHYDNILEMSTAAHRAKDLVGQLLAFSRKQMLKIKTLDINRSIRNMSGMLNRLIREDISVHYNLDDNAGTIKADPGQIDQILLNLVVNAQDAMSRGGLLTITTSCEHYPETVIRKSVKIKPGAYTVVRVTDTGAGIEEGVLPYIFEPFFTTKDRGRGTGMGLATCYGIVKQHSGYIWAESKINQGSVFTLLFPCVRGGQQDDAAVAAGSTNGVANAKGETILVVEDEPAVRKMAVLALERIGYQVIEMDSPKTCLERVQAEKLSFDLLLSDVIMPGCNGKDLYLALKSRVPGMKVLFMSGYTDNVIVDKGVLREGVHFIGKPFSIRELSRKVRAVLDGQAPA